MTDREQETDSNVDDGSSAESHQTTASNQRGTGESAANAQQREHESPEQPDDPEIKDIWPQLRKLLVFQIKLYIDAARDLLMSPMSIVVFIIDAVQGNRHENSLFESLLQFGRRTEKAINLFNQHDINDENFRGIDSILMQVEDAVKKEYTDGSVSANARDSIENSLGKLRSKLNQSKQEDE
jgi:hypothetical protein